MYIRCRCGELHDIQGAPDPCVYCTTPTFDPHRVCARCRELEELERHVERVLRTLSLI
jgi:hypothetical protein